MKRLVLALFVLNAVSLLFVARLLDVQEQQAKQAKELTQFALGECNNRGLEFQQDIAHWKRLAENGTVLTHEYIVSCDWSDDELNLA